MSVLPAARERFSPAGATAAAIDAIAPERVLVLGSFPPTGRDLDLVTQARTRDVITAALASEGFTRRGPGLAPRRAWVEQWVRFENGGAFAVDLHPLERWALDLRELTALFRDAVPVPGMRRLAWFAPHHVVLLTARGLVSRGGRLPEKQRLRVEHAVSDDPQAFARAREHAPAWGLTRALGALERAYRSGEPVSRLTQAAAQFELAIAAGPRATAERVARGARARWPRSVRVVSLSGLDGAGKSTQSEILKDLLEQVGVDVEIAWMPLGHSPRHPTLRLIRRSAAWALRLAAGGSARRRGGSVAAESNLARGVRERSDVVTQLWTVTVALVQALQHRRAAVRRAGTGRLLIFDRFVLDSSAQLRFFYGADHAFRLQKWLIRLVSPTPVDSVWLDVRPRTLAARKELQYTFEEVCRQRQLYGQEAAACRVERLDGERPQFELTDELARRIWREVGR